MSDASEGLTPLEAAAAMREMERFDEKLRRRVHGLTWLFWGVAAPAIFITFSYAASAIRTNVYGDQPAWFGLLWLPWAAAGLLFTALLWRAVGLVLPGRGLTARELALHAGVFLLATVGLVLAGAVAGLTAYPPAIVLTGIGLATAMLGLRDAFDGTAFEGGVHVAVGVLLIGFAVFETLMLAGPPSYANLSLAALWNAFASALGLGGLGVLRILRS